MTPTCPKCETPMNCVKREIQSSSLFYRVVKVYQCSHCGEITERQE